MSKNFKGSIILLVTAVIWGTSFVAQSEGMNYIQPFTYNAIRTIIGGLVLIPVIFFFKLTARRSPDYRAVDVKITALGGVCCGLALCIASSLQQFGIVYTTAGKSGFITALYVICVPLIELIFGRKQPAKIWLCVLLAIIGFYFLCITGDFSINFGDLLTLICAVFFACHIIVIDRFLERGADGMVMACIQFLTAGCIMLICMFIFEQPRVDRIIEANFSILYAGIMSCGVAYTLQIIGQRYTEPTLATLLMSLESVFAVLSGWVILNEQLTAKEFSGCCLVFSAVIFAQVSITPLIKKFIGRRTKQ